MKKAWQNVENVFGKTLYSETKEVYNFHRMCLKIGNFKLSRHEYASLVECEISAGILIQFTLF